MATYPTALPSFADPSPPGAGQYVWLDGTIRNALTPPATILVASNPALVHSTLTKKQSDELVAVCTKLGVDGRAGINRSLLGQTESYMAQSTVGTFPNPNPGITAANFPGFIAASSNGTGAIPTQLTAGQVIGQFAFYGYMGSASPAFVPMAGIYAKVSGTHANDLGADVYIYNKHDNNTGLYASWMFRSDGRLVSPPGTGAYAANGIMVAQNDGVFLSGQLDRNDSSYFGNVLQLAGGGLGNASDYGNGVPIQYNGSGVSVEGAQRVQFTTNITGWDLTLGYAGGTYYNCLQMYPGYAGIAIQSFDYSSGVPNFNLDYFGQIKANDPYSTRQGHVFAPNSTNPVGTDGTVNIYQAGSGDYFQLWLDKSDVVRGSYTDSLLDIMDGNINTNKNITCLNLQASNLVLANTLNATGSVLAGSSFEGPDIFFTGLGTPGFGTDGFLWYDTVRKAHQVFADGIKQTLSTSLFTQTADKTVANTVTETSILGTGVGNLTLPANFFVAGKTIRIYGEGYIADLLTPTGRVKFKLGSTVILDSTAAALVTITGNGRFEYEILLTCRTAGTTGTVYAQGDVRYYSLLTTANFIALLNTAATTINTTTSQVIDVTWTWGTANAANTITLTNATIEVLN